MSLIIYLFNNIVNQLTTEAIYSYHRGKTRRVAAGALAPDAEVKGRNLSLTNKKKEKHNTSHVSSHHITPHVEKIVNLIKKS